MLTPLELLRLSLDRLDPSEIAKLEELTTAPGRVVLEFDINALMGSADGQVVGIVRAASRSAPDKGASQAPLTVEGGRHSRRSRPRLLRRLG